VNRIPFDTDYDVVVLGGGICGPGAAVTLAAAGRTVLLVERLQARGTIEYSVDTWGQRASYMASTTTQICVFSDMSRSV
jgi:flavin-dependent dehydrogenase